MNDLNSIIGKDCCNGDQRPEPEPYIVPPTNSKEQSEFDEIVRKAKEGNLMDNNNKKKETPKKKTPQKGFGKMVKEEMAKEDTLSINAKECYKVAIDNPDTSINEYIEGINSKIQNEASNGGFSTTIRFRVSNDDWVNINRIMDWYRIRGFEILNFNSFNPNDSFGAGVVEYEFTISWVNASK